MPDDGGNGRNEGRDDVTTASDPHGTVLSLNAILEVLAHNHRREILSALVDAPSQSSTVDELTNRITKLEAERTGKHPGRDQIEMTFHHVHLPKLIDVGLVEYDPRFQELRYRRCERLEGLLEYLESVEST